MPVLSIIVPVYNAQKFLPQCIESILAQTFTDFELILVNDGSTDESEKICLAYKEKDSRIKYVYKENGGAASARKAGLASRRRPASRLLQAHHSARQGSRNNSIQA